MAMKVSLCGPHSLDTSTFPLTAIELVVNGAASPPLSRMNSYLLHQVGSCELFCASTFTREFFVNRLSPSKAKTDANTSRFFAMNFLPLIEISVRHSLRCSGCADSTATVETTKGTLSRTSRQRHRLSRLHIRMLVKHQANQQHE